MHSQRWITALVALPFLIALIWIGGAAFSFLIGAVAIVGLWEYNNIVFHQDQEISAFSAIPVTGLIFGPLMIAAAHFGNLNLFLTLSAFNLIIAGLLGLARFKNDENAMTLVVKQVTGILYVPVLLSQILFIRQGQDGAAWIFFLLFLVFFGDIGAYYTGRYLGRHKLYPQASPGKTIEGAVGGLLASIGIGLIFRWIFLPHLSLIPSLCMFGCIGIVAPAGDLFESVLKRVGNIKDSGGILPGHGGILDRIDALLFAAPVAYFFKTFIVS